MLRRIEGGMFLVVSAHALTLTVEIFIGGHMVTNADDDSVPCPISSCLILVADLTRHVGLYLTLFTTVEFIIAQSLCRIRGFVSFLLLQMLAIFTCLQRGLADFITDHRIAHAVFFVTISGFFIFFVLLSQRYKLRKRDDAIPYHIFAENEFENNYKRQRIPERE